jgi:dihydroorotate dehydrogenase (NAD+) catalytic subunit
LSGPAIKPVALRMVWQARQAIRLPIIGMGGIMNGDDALEFMIAGASAVALGTANFVDPEACVKVVDGIAAYMSENKIENVNQLVGSLQCQAI